MKKAMLLAAVACAAMLALPAVASATVWHVDKTDSFSGVSGVSVFNGAVVVECQTTTIEGAYETTTTGWIKFTFHGCVAKAIGVHCTTAGTPTGTIQTTKLTFHNAVLGGKPGILLTPNHETNTFAHFSCFGIPATVHGNGLLGTVPDRECETRSQTATIEFSVSATSPPSQQHTEWTGTKYGLTSTFSGGSSTPSTEELAVGITFLGGERTFTCTG